MSRSHRSDAVGVVFLLFGSENHPVRSKKGGFATSFLMSRPPLLAVMQGGESPASPFFVVERGSKNCFVVQSPVMQGRECRSITIPPSPYLTCSSIIVR